MKIVFLYFTKETIKNKNTVIGKIMCSLTSKKLANKIPEISSKQMRIILKFDIRILFFIVLFFL